MFLDRTEFPFGMTLVGGGLYVANTDAILRFPYKAGDTQVAVPGAKVIELPAGTINHHWTKNIIASPGWVPPLRNGGLEQQCGRERDGERGQSRNHPGG